MTATLDERRALESLRNGVPSSAAIRTLGCEQPAIEERFRRGIDMAAERALIDKQERGLVVQGDFGTGKSHLLGYLSQAALREGFVCSKVVISKETPLYDAGKVFRAAIEAAELPDARGLLLEEVDLRLGRRKDSEAYAAFTEWAADEKTGPWQGFAASLKIWENPPSDVEGAILGFWGGQTITVAQLRGWLRKRGLQSAFAIPPRPKAAELQPQHAQFAARLFRAAGYKGWVVLLDEVELAGRYSRLQRARSYAELARWLGLSQSGQMPGIFCVAAITEDFVAEMLDARQDRELAGDLLRSRGDDSGSARADLAMKAMTDGPVLQVPNMDVLQKTHDRLRELHSLAHDWDPPVLAVRRDRTGTRMRSYIRRWITEWDLARFRGGEAREVQAIDLPGHDFREDPDLETPPEEPGANELA